MRRWISAAKPVIAAILLLVYPSLTLADFEDCMGKCDKKFNKCVSKCLDKKVGVKESVTPPPPPPPPPTTPPAPETGSSSLPDAAANPEAVSNSTPALEPPPDPCECECRQAYDECGKKCGEKYAE